jgi:hypothetical protein
MTGRSKNARQVLAISGSFGPADLSGGFVAAFDLGVAAT